MYFLCRQQGFLNVPMTDNFLWSEPSMLVIMRSVSVSLHFEEPVGQGIVEQGCLIPIVNVIW